MLKFEISASKLFYEKNIIPLLLVKMVLYDHLPYKNINVA